MSDIYGYLDKKSKEIEELKLREAKLIKEAKSACKYHCESILKLSLSFSIQLYLN